MGIGMKGDLVALTVLGIVMFVISTITMIALVNDSYDVYVKESLCVSEYISVGIERRDIITGRGTCYVK